MKGRRTKVKAKGVEESQKSKLDRAKRGGG